jgi:alpha-mannosidase
VEKIKKQTELLKRLRYRNVEVINEFRAAEEPGDYQYKDGTVFGKYDRKMRLGDFWSGRDKYIWLNCKISVPAQWRGEEVLGVFDFGTTGGGHNSGFESLVFMNGIPYQGVDSNHLEVFFPGSAGKTLNLDFRLWSGLEGGGAQTIQYHQLKQAFIGILDPAVDGLHYMLKNLAETVRLLPEDNPQRYKAETILTQGYNLVDFTNPESEAFRTSAGKALDYYHKALSEAAEKKEITVSFIGHTHIDLAWKWRYKHSREKAERSFSTVLRLMERYPEYVFLQTQAQMYESVKEDHPKLYGEIKKKVAAGQWEASGAMWVESDCNIPSGESLVRQILYGKNFFKKEFGVENTFLWLPDVFGYSWALPQILKKSGIDTFITTKISWNETNRLPHDTFIWTGIDGTPILTHFITTPDENSTNLYYTYNGNILPRTARGIWTTYRDKGLNKSLLLSYGYGDGGGGVTRNMLENMRAISKIPGLPAVKTERVADYLNSLHKRVDAVKDPRLLHTWDRELYLEYHRGTYTSQAYVKYMNRRLELLYRNAEIIQSLATVKNKKWDNDADEKLRRGWKLILKNHFHDIIPGSSITEVYRDTKEDYEEAHSLGIEAHNAAFSSLCGKDEKSYSVFNTAGWNRGGMVCLPVKKETTVTASAGTDLPLDTQLSDFNGEKALYAYVPEIEPMGVIVLKTGGEKAGAKKAEPFKTGTNTAETPFYKIKWNKAGQLVSVYDKETKREALKGPGNELQIFEDRPRSSDAWEIEANVIYKKEIISALDEVTIAEQGPLFIRIRFAWSYNKSKITQDLMLYSKHKRIDFRTTVDWRERSKLLKTAFPVDVRAVSARYDIQYGSLERPTHRSTTWDAAQFEVVGHQWADLSETDFGVSLLNDSKYGYDILGNVMRLSLLKSAEFPDTEADYGIHCFTYSLYVHREPWYNSETIPLAWDLNDPLIAAGGKAAFNKFINLSAPGMALDALKKSEDGNDLIIRLHESRGGKASLQISFNVPVKGWAEADLMENPQGNYEKADKAITRDVKPFEIVTYRIRTFS